MTKLDSLYKQSPIWLQNTMVSTYGLYWHWLRFGGNYSQFEKDFVRRESFTFGEWQAYQKDKLIRLLNLCSEKVPYYRNKWTNHQKRSAAQGKLDELPLLEKKPLRDNPLEFCHDDKHPFPKLIFHTSGTTGTPIQSIWTVSELRESIAVREVRSARWAGVSFRLPRATFSGRLVEPDPSSKGPFHRYNSVEKQVYFSAFHLRPDSAQQYVKALHQYKIQWMTGYAVSFYLLAKFILEDHLEIPPLKAIITTSEKLTPEMRIEMEKAYHCRIYEEYSTVENALFASECEHGRLHLSPDIGIMEILRPDGSACEPDEVGEVVATCLMRDYQPLIRFRLGDLAAWNSETCPCGRSMPILKDVVGRIEEIVTGPDGRQLVRFHGIFVHQPHIIEGQVIQETLDRIRVKVVPTEGFEESDKKDIITRVQQRMGFNINVFVEPVSKIERTKSGKFKAVISLLDNNKKNE